MAPPVIELCRTCGFDIPADADDCPACAGHRILPSRAARQVAGLALPTRSARALPSVRPRPAPPDRPLGPARAARAAFSFTVTLALITATGAVLTSVSSRPGVAFQIPAGTTELLDHVTTLAATASVVTLVVGLAAAVEWTVRAAVHAIRSRAARAYP